MRCLTYFARVLGICLIGLGTIAFMGCSGSDNSLGSTTTPGDGSAITNGNDNTGQQDNTSGFLAVLPCPTFPKAEDWALAKCKPSRWEGFATLAPFSICGQSGRIINATGDKKLVVNFCKDNVDSQTVLASTYDSEECKTPIGVANDYSSVKSLLPIIFPRGRNCISLSDYTDLELGAFGCTLTNPLFNTKIKRLKLCFDVFDCFGEPEWTLPTSIEFKPQTAYGKSIINGSKLILTWNPSKRSIPPHGRAFVVAIIKFYNNGRLIIVVKKPVPIINNTATFVADKLDCSDPTISFTSVSIDFDLTKEVPFNECDDCEEENGGTIPVPVTGA